MTGPQKFTVRHLGGLVFALVLLTLCRGLWLWVPGWIGGTPLRDLGLLVTFLGWVGMLTAGERLWQMLGDKPGGHDG